MLFEAEEETKLFVAGNVKALWGAFCSATGCKGELPTETKEEIKEDDNKE